MGSIGDLYETVPSGTPKPPHAKPTRSAPKPATGGSIGDLYGGTATAPTPTSPTFTLDAGNLAGTMQTIGNLLSKTPVPSLIEKLDRPRQGVEHTFGPDRSFTLGGVSPEDQDVDRAAERKALGIGGIYDVMPHPVQGVLDFGVDTASDPTIIGGKIMDVLRALGITRRVAGVAKPAIAAAAKPVGAAIAARTPQLVKDNIDAVRDFITPGGAAARRLGPQMTGRAFAADNRQAALAEEAQRILTERFDKTIAALPDADRLEVYRALNGERDTRGMTPAQAAAVAEGRRLTTQAAGMQADASGRLKLAYGGGKLAGNVDPANVRRKSTGFVPPPKPEGDPTDFLGGDWLHASELLDTVRPGRQPTFGRVPTSPVIDAGGPTKRRLLARVDRPLDLGEMADFAAPTDQGIMGAGNIRIRSRYVPQPFTPAQESGRPERTFNLLDPSAPNLRQRDDFTVSPTDVSGIDAAFRSMLAKAAEQGTAGRMRDELGVRLGDSSNNPDLLRLFERTAPATGDERSLGQRNAELWRNIVNIPKNTVSTIGLKHGLVNVPALAHQSEGAGAAAEGLSGGARALVQSPAERFAANREGILGGVIAPFGDRVNPIADALDRIPGPLGKLIGGASEKANTLTWAIDDAAKQAVFKSKKARFIKDGMSEADATDKAARDTLHDMVDYRHLSAATKMLQNVAPFATFRSKIPGAVLRSVARNPQRLLTANRLSQGLYGSGRVQVPGTNDEGDPNNFVETNPISDVVGLADPGGVPRYARSMIADPLKALLSLPGDVGEWQGALSPRQAALMRYFTYGQHVLPYVKDGKLKAGFLGQSAAGYVPMGLGEDVLGVAGGSDFPTPDALSMLLGGTVGGYVR